MGSVGQKATRAVQIENMNEAQLNKEIAKAERVIDRAERQMEKSGQQTALGRGLSEQFPLGVGGDGWTAARRRQFNRDTERTVRNAADFTKAMQDRDNAQNRLNQLNKALEDVKGTGKTQSQIREERVQKEVRDTKSTLRWKTVQQSSFNGSSYTPKIIKAGDYV